MVTRFLYFTSVIVQNTPFGVSRWSHTGSESFGTSTKTSKTICNSSRESDLNNYLSKSMIILYIIIMVFYLLYSE